MSASSPEALPGSPPATSTATSDSVACPACGTGRLVPHGEFARCPVCGHQAGSALVAEAAWLLSEQARLVARLSWVQERIAAGPSEASGQPAQLLPGPDSGPRSGPPSGSSYAPPSGPGATRPVTVRPDQPPLAAQTILLGGGATLMVIAAVVFAAVAWDRIGAWGQLGLLAVVVAALSGAAHGLRHRFRATAQTLAAIAAAVAAVGLIAAPRLGLGAAWMRDRSWAWAAIALLAVTVLSLVLRRVSGLGAWRIATLVAALSAVVSAVFALSPGSWQGPSPLGVAALAILGAVLLVQDARPTAAPASWTARDRRSDLGWLGAGASLAAAALVLSGYGDDAHRFQWTVVWAVVAAAAVVVRAIAFGPHSAAPSNLRELASGWAGVAAGNVPVLAVSSALGPTQPLDLPNPDQVTGSALAAVLGLALLGSALALATTWRRGELTPRIEASVAGPAAALTIWLLSPGQVSAHETVTTGLVCGYLAVIAATCFAIALGQRWPGWPAWAGAAVGSIAGWVLLGNHSVSTVEAYTLSSAGLLLLAGAVAWLVGRREPAQDPSSLVLTGPGLAMALLPSAVWAFGEAVSGQGPQRGVIVLAVGAVLAVGGAVLRWQAPFVVGLAGALVAAAGQLWSLSDLVPRWVALAAAGALLVGAGFGFELVSTTGRRFWRFTRALR